MTEKSQSSRLLPSSCRVGARPWWFLRLFGAGGVISKWSFRLTNRLGSTMFGETFWLMSSPACKHVGLKVIGLAAGTKLYLMLDDGSFFIWRASSKDWDLQSKLNTSVEICLVDSGSKTQEIPRGDGEGTGIIYANFHGRAGFQGDVTTRTTVRDITWHQWSLLFGVRLCKVPGVWMQLLTVISSDLYRARGFVSFAFFEQATVVRGRAAEGRRLSGG